MPLDEKDGKTLRKGRPFRNKKLVLIVSAMLIGTAFIGVLAVMNLAPNTVFIGEKTHADSVTIYQNGVTFVTYKENVTLNSGVNTIAFYLPSSVILETLKIDGVKVLQIKTTGEQPYLEKGDEVLVRTSNGEYSGVFRGWSGNNLVLVNGNKTMILYDVQEIEVLNMAEPHLGEISVNATVEAEGNAEIRVSYLMRGTSWQASYFLDLDTGDIECWATVKGVENWKDVNLTLVSGGPHIVYRYAPSYPYIYYDSMKAEATAGSNGRNGSWSSSELDEYHEYTLNRKITFYKGETAKLPLFSGNVKLRQEYYWSGNQWSSNSKVINRYYINNTLDEPLPSGVVEFYRSGKWVGEDRLTYTPIGDENPVMVGYAYDIKVSSKTISSGWSGEYYPQTYSYSGEITVKNFKTKSIMIKIEVYVGSGNDLNYSGTPSPKYDDGKLMWTITVNSGSIAKISYNYSYTQG